MIFLPNSKRSSNTLNSQKSTQNGHYHQSNKPSTNTFTHVCTKILAIFGTICLLGGIGILVYGLISTITGAIISGSIIIGVGVIFFITMVILYLKSNSSSTFYSGRQANNNRIETNYQQKQQPQQQQQQQQQQKQNNMDNNNAVIFAVNKFDNLIKSDN